eukprot:CAMPEP_0206805146 /NCGR_PEP_ID=MMETSP0975-20121206/4077_1 /ASSEMBLY_ACC=CAM_ASM_000399 /TAXON_ID=483370 /ORGANISM="non described non described, Strain CCMP2097" /LENGTH=37 /DNA_ID= /DNA_START= /DNA_END= /DNA_ORIENTATION=
MAPAHQHERAGEEERQEVRHSGGSCGAGFLRKTESRM